MLRQLDLFATGRAGFDAEFQTLHRTELSHGAWIDHAPGWVRGHDALFDELERGLPWRRETMKMYDKTVDVPRLLARCRDPRGNRSSIRCAQAICASTTASSSST